MQPIDASEKATAETQKKVPQEPAGYSDTQGIYICIHHTYMYRYRYRLYENIMYIYIVSNVYIYLQKHTYIWLTVYTHILSRVSKRWSGAQAEDEAPAQSTTATAEGDWTWDS